MPDLSDQLRGYMDHIVERTDVESFPVRLEQSEPDPERKQRPGWVVAVAAAITTLLLIGGSNALLNAYRETPPAEEATPTTEATTTTVETEVVVAPTTVDQMTIDVSSSVVPGLGTLRWTLLEGDDATLPPSIAVDPAGGYMSAWGDEAWHSEDALVWTAGAATAELEGYRWVATGDKWAIGHNDDSSHLYERLGDEWVRVPLPDPRVPDTTGITWQPHVSLPLEDGDVRLIDGTLSGTVDWGAVYGLFEVDCRDPEPCEIGPWAEWDPPSETWRVTDPNRGSSLAVLYAEVDGNTISFMDQATDGVVLEVTGTEELPVEQILSTMRTYGGGLILSGGWVSQGETPWTWIDFPWKNWTSLMEVPEGGFAGYEFVYDWVGDLESPLVSATAWASSDGITWVDNGEPQFADPTAEHMMVRSRGNVLRASVITGFDSSTGMETAETWESTDGVSWSQVDDPFPAWVEEDETEFGLVATSMPQSTHMFWVSTDGTTWHEVVGPPGSHEPMGAGYSGAGAAGDILWVSVGEDSGSRRLWIGRFEP